MSSSKYTPIALFCYNRKDALEKTIEALQKNYLAKESHLIIFSDAAKADANTELVDEVRSYLKTISGFQSVEIVESLVNKGLTNSIIEGVTKIVNENGKVIVLEDDLVTTPNFLSYMNQGLDFYQDDKDIASICGYGLKINRPANYSSDFYLHGRSSSWGWATWKDKWEQVDWQVKDWQSFKNDKKAIKEFNKNGSDMSSMLQSVVEGHGQSWAIRFCYSQFRNKQYSVFPFKSLVNNIGFSSEGTNTKSTYSRFKVQMDDGKNQNFNFEKLKPDTLIDKEVYSYHSIPVRVYSKLRYLIGF